MPLLGSNRFARVFSPNSGLYLSVMERDWPGDRPRSYKVAGVVTRLLANEREASAYAAYRGIRSKPAAALAAR